MRTQLGQDLGIIQREGTAHRKARGLKELRTGGMKETEGGCCPQE